MVLRGDGHPVAPPRCSESTIVAIAPYLPQLGGGRRDRRLRAGPLARLGGSPQRDPFHPSARLGLVEIEEAGGLPDPLLDVLLHGGHVLLRGIGVPTTGEP